MKKLTTRQTEILNFLKTFIQRNKYPPTMREIAAHFSISPKGAYDHIKALEKKNQIRCNINRSRAIEIIGNDDDDDQSLIQVPLLGHVAAGIPLLAEENLEGTISLPCETLGKGNFFALHVQGDSMQDAGILDGDIAVFLEKPTADNGDIVVARINDEAVTLKRFYKEKNRVKLKAENPVYPPIYTQNVRILGKLKSIIRNYE
jgi:repressor LexA